jgi:hypothetical protein
MKMLGRVAVKDRADAQLERIDQSERSETIGQPVNPR